MQSAVAIFEICWPKCIEFLSVFKKEYKATGEKSKDCALSQTRFFIYALYSSIKYRQSCKSHV